MRPFYSNSMICQYFFLFINSAENTYMHNYLVVNNYIIRHQESGKRIQQQRKTILIFLILGPTIIVMSFTVKKGHGALRRQKGNMIA